MTVVALDYYSHVLMLDADVQHLPVEAPRLLERDTTRTCFRAVYYPFIVPM